MAYNVKFLKGTAAQYKAVTPNADTFYYTTDDKNLYLGSVKLSSAAEISAAVERIAKNETDIKSITGTLTTLTGAGEGSVSKAVADAKKELSDKIGDTTGLKTTAKTDLVSAVNELKESIGSTGESGAVTIDEGTSDDYAKVYTIKQGGSTVGSINIPKDMVVKSGSVVVNPTGQTAGTYIELVLANATEDKIYVNVGSLVDIYTAQKAAASVQIAIDSSTREISATIVDGAVTEAKVAASAITTTKIADANVTEIKLHKDVKDKLALAVSALQAADITSGKTDGSIAVKGTDVAVTGLKSAAFKDATAFDEAGAAAAVEGKLETYKTTTDAAVKKNTDAIADINNEKTGILAQAKTDAATKASTAETNAKAYTDTALTWGTIA